MMGGHLGQTYLQVGASVEQLPRGARPVELSVLDEQRHDVTKGGSVIVRSATLGP